MQITTIASLPVWIGFIVFVLAMLAVDLGLFNRGSGAISVKQAFAWSGVWIGLALVFNVIVWHFFGRGAAVEFLTGYLIEKSLSVDNIFVFVVIFGALAIPAAHQRRVLFWGILSALVLRAGMIFGGTALLARFHWLIYVFGAFLVLTGLKLLFGRDESVDPEKSVALRLARRVIPSTPKLSGDRFWVRENGRWLATPLLMALLLVEFTDVVFALDSIPAIFAVTQDPFIVFTSNIFAILGLRSLFFVLAGFVDKFAYLKVGLAGVLVFVGTKMAIVDFVKIPAFVSLGVIAAILAGSVVASLLSARGRVPQKAESV